VPLTFHPNPPEAKEEDFPLSAADNQAELMRWHYRLGHLTFAKLKQLALHGKIPKKLALLIPPKCTGCLFGAMTKIPWRGKEPKSSHKVFTATKPVETASVGQMVSTKVGFFAQLKGKLTKKRYRCCTIFVDHYSRLHFLHNQIDDSFVETVATKHAFEKFATKHGHRWGWCNVHTGVEGCWSIRCDCWRGHRRGQRGRCGRFPGQLVSIEINIARIKVS